MSESPLRNKYKEVLESYDDIHFAATYYFQQEGMLEKGEQLWTLEADPFCLECITDRGNVLHVEFELVEPFLGRWEELEGLIND